MCSSGMDLRIYPRNNTFSWVQVYKLLHPPLLNICDVMVCSSLVIYLKAQTELESKFACCHSHPMGGWDMSLAKAQQLSTCTKGLEPKFAGTGSHLKAKWEILSKCLPFMICITHQLGRTIDILDPLSFGLP